MRATRASKIYAVEEIIHAFDHNKLTAIFRSKSTESISISHLKEIVPRDTTVPHNTGNRI